MRGKRICCAARLRATLGPIVIWTSAAVEPPRIEGFGAEERNSMRDGGRDTGSPDSAREEGHLRSGRGRQTFHRYGYRDDWRGHLPTYAALDLGTNNCRLLVARPAGDRFRGGGAFSRIIRLGEGISPS